MLCHQPWMLQSSFFILITHTMTFQFLCFEIILWNIAHQQNHWINRKLNDKPCAFSFGQFFITKYVFSNFIRLQYVRLFELNSSNFFSSDQTIFFHCVTVHFLYWKAHSNRFNLLIMSVDYNGFREHTWPNSPAIRSRNRIQGKNTPYFSRSSFCNSFGNS